MMKVIGKILELLKDIHVKPVLFQALLKYIYLKITTLRENQVSLRPRQDSGGDIDFRCVLMDNCRAGKENQPIQASDKERESVV